MKIPISVIILTLNEEKNIENCLRSIKWSDEIFVVDSGSSDKTLDIAKKYTDKIYQHRFFNYSQQRNWAQNNLPIKNEWIFHLDADERPERNLAFELVKIVGLAGQADGLMVARKTYFRGRWIKRGGHFPVYHLRIFKKEKGYCENRLYDQHFIVKGKTEKTKNGIINIIDPALKQWKGKHQRWAYLEASEIISKKKREVKMNLRGNPIEKRNWFRYKIYYILPLFIRPFLYFFYRYVIRLGFLDSRQGLIFHFWQGLWFRLKVDKEIFKLKINQRKK